MRKCLGAAMRALVVGCLGAATLVAAGQPRTPREAAAPCPELTPPERALARLFETSPEQRRHTVRCNPVLARVARARALDMGRRRYFNHVNPDGVGPNRQVEQAGYALPAFYGRRKSANNVEVISAGDESPDEAWRGWLRSRSHRRQILGLNRFFADQEDYGVGHAAVPGSRYGDYWVLITARH